MTEESDDGQYLVGVRAQVMMRDDSTGMWVPMGGGGLSNVSVRKRLLQTDPNDHDQHEYLIYGERITDHTVVLSCTIKKDFEYNKVMPTFHHWRTGDNEFGLTFQTATDARTFDKGVRMAVDDLMDGECPGPPHHQHPHHHYHQWPCGSSTTTRRVVNPPLFQSSMNMRPCTHRGVRLTITELSEEGLHGHPLLLPDHNLDGGDDKVFMTLNLPVERESSWSSSGSVTTTSSSRHTPTTTPVPTPDHPTHTSLHGHPTVDCHPHPPLPPHHQQTPLPTPPESSYPIHFPAYPLTSGGGGGGILTTNTSPSSTMSTSATTAASTCHTYPHPNHYKINFTPRPKSSPTHNNNPDKFSDLDCEHKPGCHPGSPLDPDKVEVIDSYSYVELSTDPQMTRPHEYYYPVVDALKDKRGSIASIKKELVGDTHAPQLPTGKRPKRPRNKKLKLRCKHCHDMYTDEINSRGSCDYAPDYVRTAIDKLTCISCAQGMLYHCMSDAEGDFSHHPCDCRGVGGTPDGSCGKRWLGLTLLSLLVPCLWCYIPLRSCHRCAVACGLCGGKHQAS